MFSSDTKKIFSLVIAFVSDSDAINQKKCFCHTIAIIPKELWRYEKHVCESKTFETVLFFFHAKSIVASSQSKKTK